ncbi:hypothetical protein SAMN06265222_107266 [Neorhodopirellula lusitana]|uniref:Secreted protein n=1 Tax=Neorhodopirellula lusitana TaxID=445327 RepID=A0ABY1QB71_9BACT|nr:hypothetical protein [Neorhodopirellula lusitana]SMP62216.1 hypothetical protein SAMN06265222_107266 [Neorhodopirellula lusitana]
MNRSFRILALVACFAATVATTTTASAEQATQSPGLIAGDPVGAFQVTKLGGAEDDGVDAGQTLCYRCKYGLSPMVMVFTRSTDESAAKLLSKFDETIGAYQDQKLKGLVTLIGGSPAELKTQAAAIAGSLNTKHVPVVIAKDSKNGPASYKLNKDTEVTVVLINQSQVVARHDFDVDNIDPSALKHEIDAMLQ